MSDLPALARQLAALAGEPPNRKLSEKDILAALEPLQARIAEALEMVRVLRDELDAYRGRERTCPCCNAPPPPNEDAETYHAEDCAWVQSGDLLAAEARR